MSSPLFYIMWDNLELSDKARMIGLAVKSGITDLNTIHNVYNKFAEGGNKLGIKSKVKNKVKDIAYKIGTDEDVYKKGNANIINIVHALLRKNSTEPEDDNKRAYIYGTGERFPEVEEPIKGFDYTNYLNKYNYKGVKDVYGTINPTKEYSVDEKYEPLVRALAESNYHMYDNADSMFSDVLGYRDDVGNFIHQFGVDNNGNVVIHDSDVYDFNPADYNYTRGAGKILTKVEAALMNKVGTPYIIRQENQPVKFEGDTRTSSGIVKHLENLTEEDIARITNSGLIIPAELIHDHRDDYDPDKNFSYKDGGIIHIKKENRGKFTALKERTGHSATWFKEHGTPAQKKMAVFALNARKWKH